MAACIACAPQLDWLMVPGGRGFVEAAEPGTPVVHFVKQRASQVKVLMSVCTGAAILATAGVLDGLHATTNKNAYDIVKRYGPKVKVSRPAWLW